MTSWIHPARAVGDAGEQGLVAARADVVLDSNT